MEAIRPLLAQVAPPARLAQHLHPYVVEQAGKRSLHFSVSAIQSRIDLQRPERLDLEYTRLMAAFQLVQAEPQAIAMIGLGGGSLARHCRRVLPAARICVAEINPHIVALREQFAVPADDERFAVVPVDGADLVRTLDGHADVLLVDGYTAAGLPRRLSSQRFFDDCAVALAPGGVLVMNLYADATRVVQVEERIRRSFAGLSWSVADRDGCNRVVYAVRARAESGAHGRACGVKPGPLRRPPTLGADDWAMLQGAFARVLAAWKEACA